MDKDIAVATFGSIEQAAQWMGLPPKVVKEWNARLHPTMSDRFIAAVFRRAHARARNLTAKQWFLDPRNESHLWWTLGAVSIATVYAAAQHEVPPIFAAQPGGDEKETRRRPARMKRTERQEPDAAPA